MEHIIKKSDFENHLQIKEYLHYLTLDLWQHRWETSNKGRTTFSFFPTVPELPRISFSKLSTQTLSGHGPFMAHLHRIGKSEDDLCQHCHERDDPQHRILACPLFTDERSNLIARTPEPICLHRLPELPLEFLEGFARDDNEAT